MDLSINSYSDPKEVGVFPSAARSAEPQESDLEEAARTLDLHPSGVSCDLGENAWVYVMHYAKCIHALQYVNLEILILHHLFVKSPN